MPAAYAETLPTVRSLFSAVHEFATETERKLRSAEMMSSSHETVENYINSCGREWARLSFEAQLALRAE